MKLILSGLLLVFFVGSASAQFSEYDTLGTYQYTTTYEKAEFIAETDTSGHWEFSFRHADGDVFVFKHAADGFADNLLLNKGRNGAADSPVNTGKKFLVKYCDLVEHIWYDEDLYWWDDTYEWDEELNYYVGLSASFAP